MTEPKQLYQLEMKGSEELWASFPEEQSNTKTESYQGG